MAMLKPSLQLRRVNNSRYPAVCNSGILPPFLQMPALELQAHIRELLESNGMLEPVEDPNPPACSKPSSRPRRRAAVTQGLKAPLRSSKENWAEHIAGCRNAVERQ